MGAATSLYSATCFALGKYANGNPYPANLSAVVGLSGWLPCSKFGSFCFFSSQLDLFISLYDLLFFLKFVSSIFS